MKATFKPLLILVFVIVMFASCKKDFATSSIISATANEAAVTAQVPLAIQTSTKTFNVLNANSGSLLKFFETIGSDQENTFTQSPVFVGNLMINFYGRTVIATNIKDNALEWKTVITAQHINTNTEKTSYPVIAGNLLMFAFSDQNNQQVDGIYALNILTGKLVWVNNENPVSDRTIPTFAKGLLLVNGNGYFSSGYFFAIDVQSGKTEWTIQDYGNVYPACTDSNYFYYTKVMFTVHEPADTLFARNISDGSIRWSKAVYNIYSFACFPLVYGDQLYTSSSDTLLCINKNNGKIIWKYSPGFSNVYFTAPYADNELLYVTTTGYANTRLYALKQLNGKPQWSVPINIGGSTSLSEGPVVMHDKVYQRENNASIDAFDKLTGNTIFKKQIRNYQQIDPNYSPTYIDEANEIFYSSASGMH